MHAHTFFIISFGIYFAVFVWHLVALLLNRVAWQDRALKGIYLGFGFHLVGLILGLFQSPSFFLKDSSQTYALLSFLIVLSHLLLSLRYRVHFLALFTLPLVLFLMLASHLAVSSDNSRELLIGYWLKLHVILTFVAYSAFASACIAGLGYLIQDKQLKSHHPGKVFRWIPSLDVLDEINTRSLIVGFLFLTLGLLSGFFWAKSSGGSFWLRDPKVLSALAIWVLYFVLMWLRVTSRVRGKKIAVVSVFGFVLVIISLLGVSHTAVQ